MQLTWSQRLTRQLFFWWHTRHVRPGQDVEVPVLYPDGSGFALAMREDAHKAFVWVELTLYLEETPESRARRFAMYERLRWINVMGEDIKPHHALAFTHPEACEEAMRA